jgi:hypothetical protein
METWKGSIGQEQDQNPAVQTLNPIASCLASGVCCALWALEGLGSSAPTALLVVDHVVFLLGWLCSLRAAFLGSCSTFLAPPISWGLHCIFGFTLTAHALPSQGLPAGIQPATCCLDSQAFLWSPRGSLHDSVTCILPACKISITWMKPRSASSLSSSWALLEHGCSRPWMA